MIITATLYEVELIKNITRTTARTELITELLTEIHDMHQYQTYCKTKDCQIKGLECDDCLYQNIKDLLTLKKQKGAEEQCTITHQHNT